MPSWSQYREIARSRGALAFELYVVESTVALSPDDVQAALPQHLDYQKQMEQAGKLFLAGPLSDSTGKEMSGGGLIIYRATSMAEAGDFADNDPMHQSGARTYTLRRWLINEGSISLNMGLSTKNIALS